MKLKFMAIMLAVLMIISQTQAFAATELSDKVTGELKAFGILKGDENGELNLEENITRAEFTAMAVRTLGIDDWSYSVFSFNDVVSDAWYYEDVMRLVMTGSIAGVGNGMFGPDEPITRDQAAKIIVASLGYTYLADERGGYPTGYLATAGQLGIFDKTSIDNENLTRGDVARMLYNSLDVPLMEKLHSGNDDKFVVGESTLRDVHIYSDSDGLFVKQRGIVTATPEAWLIKPYPGIENNQVVIDDVLMNAGNTNAGMYLGMEVDYYVSADDQTGPYTLQHVVPTDHNKIYTFTEKDYEGKNSSGIMYETETGTKTIKLDGFCSLVRNFRPIPSPSDSDYALDRGSVKIIDNNADGSFDYVFIEEFESVMVDSITENGIRLDSTTPFMGVNYINLEENDNISYFLTDSDGNAIGIDQLSEGDVLSIVSDDATVVKMIKGSKPSVTGTVNALSESDNIITIDDENYYLENNVPFDISIGDISKFSFNFRGEIAFVDIAQYVDLYGRILGAKESFSEDAKVRMVIPGSFSYDIKVDDSEEDNTTETPILKGANSAVKTIKLAPKVNVYGTRMESAAAVRQLAEGEIVRYSINSAGEITDIEAPEITGSDVMVKSQKRYYNGYEQIFGGINAGAFAVESTTSVLCIPDDSGIEKEDDYLASVEILNGSAYIVNGYDLISENEVARLIVIKVPLRYETATGSEEQAEAILEKAVEVLDENGDAVSKLIYWQDGVRKETETEAGCNHQSLQPGDVFLMSIGVTSGKIANIQRLARLKNLQPGVISLGNNNVSNILGGYLNMGYPVSVEYGKINDLNYRRTDVITLGMDKDNVSQKTFDINVRNTPDIYVYYKNSNRIAPGDTGMISPRSFGSENNEMVLVYEKYLSPRLVVIVKE